jgi:hypothetical protein
MTEQEKAKREVLRQLGSMSVYQQVIASRVYDAAYQNGKADGAQDAYIQGFSAANKYACKTMIACSCLALHEVYGFGRDRMQRFAVAFRQKLLDVLDAHDAIKECHEHFGIVFEDPVLEVDEE